MKKKGKKNWKSEVKQTISSRVTNFEFILKIINVELKIDHYFEDPGFSHVRVFDALCESDVRKYSTGMCVCVCLCLCLSRLYVCVCLRLCISLLPVSLCLSVSVFLCLSLKLPLCLCVLPRSLCLCLLLRADIWLLTACSASPPLLH